MNEKKFKQWVKPSDESPHQRHMREHKELLFKLCDASRRYDQVNVAYHAAPEGARKFIDIDGAAKEKMDILVQIAGMMCPTI